MVSRPPETSLRLRRERARKRRGASVSFFVAGVGFGTALYLLRVRFQLVSTHLGPFLALVAIMVALFWLGARIEREILELDDRLRELDEAARRGSPRSL